MFPTLRFEGARPLCGEQRNASPAWAGFGDTADISDGDTGDFARKAHCRRGGEEQFVVFSAMEGLFEGRAGMDGKQSGIDLGGYAGLFADVGKIGGEAVAEVYRGAGCAVTYEPLALSHAGLGIEVRSQQDLKLFRNAGRVLAGRPGFGKLCKSA